MFSPRRYTCALKRAHGKDFCLSECPARDPAVYDYARIERPEDIPARRPAGDRRRHPRHEPRLAEPGPRLAGPRGAGRRLRPAGVLAGDAGCTSARCPTTCDGADGARRRPASRFSIYIGHRRSGPHRPAAERRHGARAVQGLHEDPVVGSPDISPSSTRSGPATSAALLGVCHTFGVMCRWSGAARRCCAGATRAKSTGILENVLTAEARAASVVRRCWRGAAGRPPPARRGEPALRPAPGPEPSPRLDRPSATRPWAWGAHAAMPSR